MKTILMLLMAAFVSATALAKDKNIRTAVFTTTPVMHCHSCEQKIKNNLRFAKGVKAIETDIPRQRVTVRFDANKNTVEKLQKSFEKFGYKAEVVNDSVATPDVVKSH